MNYLETTLQSQDMEKEQNKASNWLLWICFEKTGKTSFRESYTEILQAAFVMCHRGALGETEKKEGRITMVTGSVQSKWKTSKESKNKNEPARGVHERVEGREQWGGYLAYFSGSHVSDTQKRVKPKAQQMGDSSRLAPELMIGVVYERTATEAGRHTHLIHMSILFFI